MDGRRGIARYEAVHLPDFVRLGYISRAGGVDGDQAAHRSARIHVLFAVRGVDAVALDHHRRVDAAFRETKAPNLFARAHLHRIDGPVGVSGNQQPLAVNDGDDGDGVGGIERAAAGLRDPDLFSRLLIEGKVAVRAARLVPPSGAQITEDDQVFVHHRRMRPSAVAGDAPVLLGERPLPDDLAVLVEAEEDAADAVRVDVAGLRVGGEARPADAVPRNVGKEDVEAVLPEDLAGLGIQADDALMVVELLLSAQRDDVDPPVQHHRR